MNLNELKDYHNWIGVSPAEVLRSVKKFGGWDNVFPASILRTMPRWASRVRNYFNVAPQKLKRLDEETSERMLNRFSALARVKKHITIATVANRPPSSNPLDPTGLSDIAAEAFALSGDVYEDDFGRIWYQMSAGATIYHFGAAPKYPAAEAISQTVKGGQKAVPIFKLISPDGTGGSCECIIKSLEVAPSPSPIQVAVGVGVWPGLGTKLPSKKEYQSTIGKVNESITVSGRIEENPKYQGSYNYSETAIKGLAAHNWRDVDPHPHTGEKEYYEDPPRTSSLAVRRFPVTDKQGAPLAYQV